VADLDDLILQIDDWIAEYIKLGRKFEFPRQPGGKQSIFLD
jgi:hypothetical protein